MKILIIHTGGIGDFLLTCPVIEHLAATDTVTLAGHKERLQLAVAGGIAESAHSLEALDLHTAFTKPSERFVSFANQFDRAVIWMHDEDHALEKAFEQTEIKQVEIFPGLPSNDWNRHASDYYLQCLEVPSTQPFRLNIDPDGERLDVVIHPGSGSPSKNKPLEFFQELANDFENQGRPVTWCLGPAEQERLDFHPKNILEEESLVALAQRLATAEQFIGNDSGITHLAAALGVPTTAHFIFTDPAVWAPKGDHVKVITA
jgi:ADP-heptose:LPS heptosyltransferase